ncbi:MAG: nucleotidyltransferase family protein [Bacillota bacterium]|nr:nucleotidyltransferase family protein [Bacillota bacterium]
MPATWEKTQVSPHMALAQALQQMDEAAFQILLAVDSTGRLVGTLTDGDVRRALLQGVDLRSPVASVMNPRPITLPVGTPLEAARRLMVRHSIRHVPIVDRSGRVVDLVVWQDLFRPRVEARPEAVVIMAGGQGTRLDPFTRILPKPMIPLRDKPMVEVIIDRFHAQGFGRFILSLGYKAEIVRMYFANGAGRPYRVDFVEEKEPLGTAGALSMLHDWVSDSFIVTNCDIIVELDATHLLDYHRERAHALTVVGALKEFVVPYGVLRPENGSFRIEEKPNFHFLVNTGLYVLDPLVLELVPPDTRLDMPDLIAAAQARGLKTGVYPHHGRWFDIGQWDEYQQTLRVFESMDGV